MAKSLLEYFKEDDEMADRFVDRALDENPELTDFSDFSDALNKAFDTEMGERARDKFDDNALIYLFERDKTKQQLKRNVKKDEFERIYPSEKPQKEKEFIVTEIVGRREIKKEYVKRGDYSQAEIEFLRERKKNRVPPQQIVREYNEHFKLERNPNALKRKIKSIYF